MLRLSKLTDYGILLLTHIARDFENVSRTTRDLAAVSRLPLPTVEKLLKSLSRAKILTSERGVKGGYRLSRMAQQISLAEIIEALEGPIALTECNRDGADECDVRGHCAVQPHWTKINVALKEAFRNLSLAELTQPVADFAPQMGLRRSIGGAPARVFPLVSGEANST